jgi:topoisomerase-4 subunit A
MSDEIKDKNGLEEEKSPNLENSSTESEQDAAEDANEEISTEEHSDYKPVNRFDASAVHHLSGMYQNWFLDYASYVILERAVPHIEDGLKPVQRRILHSMKRMDDGRYNKVANIVGAAARSPVRIFPQFPCVSMSRSFCPICTSASPIEASPCG